MVRKIISRHTTDQVSSLIQSIATISQYSEDIYWFCNADFKRSLYLNPAYEKILHRSSTPLSKSLKIWDSYVHPGDLLHYHPFLEMIKKIKEEGPAARYQESYRMIRSDGQIVYIADRGQPVFDDKGQYIGITGVAVDVTQDRLIKQLPTLAESQFPQTNRQRYYLKGRYHRYYLTHRQAECAFYLLQGKTAKQIAKILTISPRTVEEMLGNIKGKFGINNRPDLFEVLLDGKLIEVVFS